jgi:hypothetical protein
MHQLVMMTAQQHEILETRLSPIRPMPHVMRIDVPRVMASRKRAMPIACPQRALQRRRHRALLAADVERRAAFVLDNGDDGAVARDALHDVDR